MDEMAHSSMQEAAKIARANGTKVATFAHSDPQSLEQTLEGLRPYRCALVCIDGVYSMSGKIPPMAELDAVARVHPTPCSTSTMPTAPAFWASRAGGRCSKRWGATTTRSSWARSPRRSRARADSSAALRRFSGCSRSARAPTFSAGRSFPAIWRPSARSSTSSARVNTSRFARGSIDRSAASTRGLAALGLEVMGGATPIVSVMIGDEADTLSAGKFLFDQGYYVQSVLFPAVPYHAGVLRVQCNANHDDRVDRRPDRRLREPERGDGPARSEVSCRQRHEQRHRNGRGSSTTVNTRTGRDGRRARRRSCLIMLVAVVVLAAGETALSKGMKQVDRMQGGWVEQAIAVARNGWIAAGLVLLLAHLGLYMLALKSADLSFALPLTAASYPLARVLARFYLHEEVSLSRGLGTLSDHRGRGDRRAR